MHGSVFDLGLDWLRRTKLSCDAAVKKMGSFFFCSVKYVGMYSYGLGCALIGYDFWETRLGDRSLTKRQVLGHAAARLLALVAVPVAVYVAVFYVHLTTLVNAGPHDSAMSSGFQVLPLSSSSSSSSSSCSSSWFPSCSSSWSFWSSTWSSTWSFS